jgi:hypothetical protein
MPRSTDPHCATLDVELDTIQEVLGATSRRSAIVVAAAIGESENHHG